MILDTAAIASAVQPNSWFERVDAAARVRYERRLDRDFQETARDNRTDLLSRARVGATLRANEKLTGYVQIQFAHNLAWTPTRNFSTESFELFQAHARYADKGHVLTIGRQRINLGTERLIGSLDWANTSRSYDGLRYQAPNWEAFVAAIGSQASRPKDVRLAAVSVKSDWGSTAVIHKHDRPASGSVNIYTFTHQGTRKLGDITAGAEVAYQVGRSANRDHQAWAVHLQASGKVADKTNITVEYNAASGGQSATENRLFDNLYPTNRRFYGIMEMHSWRNLDMWAVTMLHALRSDLDLRIRAHTASLRDPRDGWYLAGGGLHRHSAGAFIDLTGLSGRELGQEFDLELVWRRDKQMTLSGGVGVFKPGAFVKRLSGENQPQLFKYVQMSVTF